MLWLAAERPLRWAAGLHDAVEDDVRREIEGLHEFLVGWFTGSLPAAAFETQFLRRFAPDLVFIPPAGTLMGLSEFASSVHGAHGSNPEFRVAIRNSRVRWESGAHVVATYEEWQRNARASTPPDNGRIATVLLQWMGANIAITGAGSGIGRELARVLAQRGAHPPIA